MSVLHFPHLFNFPQGRILTSVTGVATVLNLLSPSNTDEERIRSCLDADDVILIPGKEVKDRGARAGLIYIKQVLRDTGSDIFAINTFDWSRQSRRTSLYGLACLVPARKRVAIDIHGNVTPLTWPGLIINEFPRSVSQKIAGARLISHTKSLVAKSLEREYKYRTIEPGGVKNVLYMRTDLWYGVKAGGSIGHVAGVIDGFVRRGMNVRVLSWEKPPLINPKAEFINVPPGKFYVNNRELVLLAYNGQLVSRMTKAIADTPPDIVYARYALDCWASVAIAEMAGVPLVIEYNGSEVWIEKNWGAGLEYPEISQGIEDWVLRTAELITVVSKPLRDELVERGFDEKRILVNPNCVDPDRFDQSRYPNEEIDQFKRELGIPVGTVVAGFIGTFSPWHGVRELAMAIPMALSSCSSLHFLLIGDGPLFDEVKDLLRTADVLDRVTLTGLIPQDEAPKYLLCSDFFLSPHVPNRDGTPFFGSPTKLFEYMALGKGIIASDLDQLGEILTDGETAILVPPGDSAELAKAIERLYEDRALSDRLGKAARDLALSEYTWEAHVGRILDRLQIRDC